MAKGTIFLLLFFSVFFSATAQDFPGGFPDFPMPGDLPGGQLPELPSGFMDGFALLMLKDCLGNPPSLSTWADTNPCNKTQMPRWAGVVCTGGGVSGLRLHGMGLSGPFNDSAIEALSHISGLRSIGLSNNDLTGEIPSLNSLVALKSIFLNNNRFSGSIAGDFFSGMGHLKKVWLAGNSFSGEIPSSLWTLPHLMELHLEKNQFSGRLPSFITPALKSLNVSNNKLTGVVPESMRKFEESTFTANKDLCFPKQGEDCSAAATTAAAAESPPPGEVSEVRSWRTTIVGVVLATLFLALLVGLFIIRKRRHGVFDTLGVEHGALEPDSARAVPAAATHATPPLHSGSGGSSRRSESSKKGTGTGSGSFHGKGSGKSGETGLLVMLNQDKGTLALSDLMKSAAELLASNAVCSTYKVLLPSGVMVAVKRLRALNNVSELAFEAEIRRLARLRHPNVLPPLAFHFGDKERLLVFEYFEKGSLNYALHGDRGPYHAGLTWPTRLRILKGIARGMAYLHAELATSELPHGNLKSSNVMLGPDYEPLLADYGLAPLLDPAHVSATMAAHRSPEAAQRRQLSVKADVYSLGVVILEVVTGKYPSQYWSSRAGGTDVVAWAAAAVEERRESELVDPEIFLKRSMAGMERLVRIGVACTDPKLDNRPNMKEAARRIEAVPIEDPAGGTVNDEATPPLKEGHAVLTSRLSARERNVDSFGIS